MKSTPHYYKSVGNQKDLQYTKSWLLLYSTFEVTELKQQFFQDLKKNIFYKRDYF